MTNIPQEYMRALESAVGKVDSIDILSGTNNLVCKFRSQNKELVAKFYLNKGTHVDNELFLYSVLPKEAHSFLKELVVSDESRRQIQVPFAVFEQLEGKSVLDHVKEGSMDRSLAHAVIKDLHDFLDLCFRVRPSRFGYLKGSLEGSHDSYLDFVFDYQVPTSRTLFHNPTTAKLSDLPFRIVQAYRETFDISLARLCPIDLNLSNLYVCNRRLKIIDPGGVIAGPPFASYGEFIGHTYGEELCAELMASFPRDEHELKILHSCAALSNMNVLAFIVRNKICPPEQARPWGNKRTFIDLINEHARYALDD